MKNWNRPADVIAEVMDDFLQQGYSPGEIALALGYRCEEVLRSHPAIFKAGMALARADAILAAIEDDSGGAEPTEE